MIRARPAVFVPLIALAASCSSARLISRDDQRGTVALEGNRDGAMKQAHELMVQHCQGPYRIVSEGRAPGGTNGDSEWHISYICGPHGETGERAPVQPAYDERPRPADAGHSDATATPTELGESTGADGGAN